MTGLAAQNFYVSATSGYDFSFASQNITSSVEDGIVERSSVLIRGSFGRGIVLKGCIGYTRNEHIGIELGASYLKGSRYFGSCI